MFSVARSLYLPPRLTWQPLNVALPSLSVVTVRLSQLSVGTLSGASAGIWIRGDSVTLTPGSGSDPFIARPTGWVPRSVPGSPSPGCVSNVSDVGAGGGESAWLIAGNPTNMTAAAVPTTSAIHPKRRERHQV